MTSEYYNEYILTENINIFKFYLDVDNVWRRTELKWLFDYLLKNEEYEKCIIIDKLMEKHYIANIEETNYLYNELIMHRLNNNKCDFCKINDEIGVYATDHGPFSLSYCKECLNHRNIRTLYNGLSKWARLGN